MYLYKSLSLLDAQSPKNTARTSTKILLRTKQLTLSRDKFHSFLNSHSRGNLSEKSIYEYPLIKPKMKHSESQKNINNKNNNVDVIFPYKLKKIIKNRHLNNKKLEQFFISGLNDEISNKRIEINKNNSELNKISFSKLNKKFIFSKTNKNIFKRDFSFLNNIKQPKKEKQIYLLIDSIFSEKKDNTKESKIKYDESEIFGYKEKYLTYLKKELSLLHKGKKEIEKKSNISYEYENRIYGKIILELNSVNILVTNKDTKEEISSINIPFNLICLFYLSHIKELAYIALGLFYKENFEEINSNLSLNQLKEIIINQIYLENNDLKYKYNIDDEDKKIISDEYLKRRNLKNRDNIRYNLLSLPKKESYKQIIFENCTFYDNININSKENIFNHSNNSEILKIIFDTNINIINFSWISLNNNYNIKITMPKIIIKIPKFRKELSHFIHRELLVYLLMNNFENFNYILIHYLFALKKFRAGIYKALSYNHLNKLYPFFANIINNESYNAKNLINENYHITNIRLEEYENSLNDNEYIFYVSDEDKFRLYKMKSYILYIYSLEGTKNSKIFFFNFSFYQMKILYYKSKYENLLQFIQKLLKYNSLTKKIFFDYNYFSSFKDMSTNQIDNYFKECSLNIKYNNKDNDNEMTENNFVIKLIEPKFISISLNKKKLSDNINDNLSEEKKIGNVGKKLIEKLIGNDIKNWGKILWENKDEIEPLKNKKIKKIVFPGNKDFQTIFKKFIKD